MHFQVCHIPAPPHSSASPTRYETAAPRCCYLGSNYHNDFSNSGNHFQIAANCYSFVYTAAQLDIQLGWQRATPGFQVLILCHSLKQSLNRQGFDFLIALLRSYEKTFVLGRFPFALDSCQEQQNGPRQNVMWV